MRCVFHQNLRALGGIVNPASLEHVAHSTFQQALALDGLVKFEDAPAQDQGFPMDYDEPLKPADQPQQPAAPTAYTSFRSSAEINYTPEEALRQGLGMVSAMDTGIKTLDLGNKMRKDAWMRDIERCVKRFGDIIRYMRPQRPLCSTLPLSLRDMSSYHCYCTLPDSDERVSRS
jgi:hypothetical protein